MQQETNNSSQSNGVLYAVYGSLRNGFGNNRLLQNESSQYLGTQIVNIPFKMVSMGGFPGLVGTPEVTRDITIEVFRVTDAGVENRLDSLEGYPGWYDKQTIETKWGTAFVYTQTEAQVHRAPLVEGGDWKEFVNQKY